jgi:hypothetical protein
LASRCADLNLELLRPGWLIGFNGSQAVELHVLAKPLVPGIGGNCRPNSAIPFKRGRVTEPTSGYRNLS